MNKVQGEAFEYNEQVREFTGLVFHCPKCDNVFHLHVAEVWLENPNKKHKGKKVLK